MALSKSKIDEEIHFQFEALMVKKIFPYTKLTLLLYNFLPSKASSSLRRHTEMAWSHLQVAFLWMLDVLQACILFLIIFLVLFVSDFQVPITGSSRTPLL